MQTILLVLHVMLGLALIAVILLQQGTGATAGAAFGSGASSTVFGARGSASFLTRVTGILALVFFANSFLLAYMAKGQQGPQSIVEQSLGDIPTVIQQEIVETEEPAADAPSDDLAVPDVPPIPENAGNMVDDLPQIPTE
ncbi:MAG: preprotein translocase subunit SecG [Pseudomonadota bacterium]